MDRIEENVDTAAEHVQTGEEEIRVVGKWAWQLYDCVRVAGKWAWQLYDCVRVVGKWAWQLHVLLEW